MIVPGDRADILVASLASPRRARTCRRSPGIVLTGGYEPDPAVPAPGRGGAVPGAGRSPGETYAVAAAVNAVRPHAGAGRRAPDRQRRSAPSSAGVDPLELERPDRARAPGPHDADDVRVRADRARARRIAAAHRAAGGRRRPRAARRRHPAAPRGGRPHAPRRPGARCAARAAALGLDLERGANSSIRSTSPLRRSSPTRYHELRKHKGVTEELALETVGDVTYFGTLMVLAGEADGMVSGAAHTTGDTIRPAFEVIKARSRASRSCRACS